MEKNNVKYQTWDYIKVLAAFCVINIHVQPLFQLSWQLGAATETFSRFAVPFFFITAGFFMERGTTANENSVAYVRKGIKRLFKYYVTWWVIYIPLTLYGWYGPFLFDIYSGYKLLFVLFYKYFVFFFTGNTFIGSWYISSTIIGMFVVFILLRKMSTKKLVLLATILFIVVLIQDNLGGIIESKNIWNFYRGEYLSFAAPFSQTFLIAIPLLTLGKITYMYKEKLERIKLRTVVFLIVGSLILAECENYMYNHLHSRDINDETFFTVLLAFSLILLSLNNKTRILLPENKFMRPYASFLYPSQFGLIVGIREFLKYDFDIKISSIWLFILVVSFATILFMLFFKLSRKIVFLNRLW